MQTISNKVSNPFEKTFIFILQITLQQNTVLQNVCLAFNIIHCTVFVQYVYWSSTDAMLSKTDPSARTFQISYHRITREVRDNKELIITSCPLGFYPASDKLGTFQLNYQPKQQQDLIIRIKK